MKKIALMGDSTTHGGSLTGTGISFSLDGRTSVLCGEPFECPEHGSETVLYKVSNVRVNGTPVALEGFQISCGATIICSGQHLAEEI